MKKLIATICSCFIPTRGRRHVVRNLIINGGVRTRWRMAHNLRADESRRETTNVKYPYKLAVCAIMKNEASYLREWIEYHKLVGVDKFFLYDNDSTDDTYDILRPYIDCGVVEYVRQPGERQQLPAYNDCIARHKMDARWIAFIDLDEFLVPMRSDNLIPILDKSKSMIIADWAIYGSSGHETRPHGGVLENYTWRARHSWLYKSIVNPRMVISMGCHEHDVVGPIIHVSSRIMRVNHYHCKSWAEYQLRAARGDAWNGNAVGAARYQRELFDRHNKNEVYDDTMMRFVSRLQ